MLGKSSCNFCKARNPRILYRVGDYKIWECRACGLWFTTPNPPDTELRRIYGDEYYKGVFTNIGYIDYEGDQEILRKNFQLRLEKIFNIVHSGEWLDIGCALGFLIEIVQEKGFTAYGLDLNEFAVQYCRAKDLADVRHGSSISEAFGGKRFDCVSLFDVLEHSRDPAALLREAVKSLRPGGVMLLEVWDPSSLISQLCGKRWHALEPPDHLYYFPFHCIVDFLQQENMTCVSRWRLGKFIRGEAILVKLGLYPVVRKFPCFPKMVNLGNVRINLFDNLLLIFQKR